MTHEEKGHKKGHGWRCRRSRRKRHNMPGQKIGNNRSAPVPYSPKGEGGKPEKIRRRGRKGKDVK